MENIFLFFCFFVFLFFIFIFSFAFYFVDNALITRSVISKRGLTQTTSCKTKSNLSVSAIFLIAIFAFSMIAAFSSFRPMHRRKSTESAILFPPFLYYPVQSECVYHNFLLSLFSLYFSDPHSLK